MDKQQIQQIIELERKAQSIHDDAVSKADELPKQAAKEARETVEKARADAQKEAVELIAQAKAEDQRQRIMAETQQEIERIEQVAAGHLEAAVSYVLDRLTGREQ